MIEKPTKLIIDVGTGQQTVVELTDEEISEREKAAALFEAKIEAERITKETKEALKASAKAKLIAGEPLTAEEADVLVL